MSLNSKFSTQSRLFDCSEFLDFYKCPNCKLTINEKTRKWSHNCESEKDGNEILLDRCERCKVESFSFAWLNFHRKRCIFNNFNYVCLYKVF